MAGINLNLDHLAVLLVDGDGQYHGSRWFAHPGLGELPQAKSRPRIGEIAKAVMAWLHQQGVQAVVLEDLKIEATPEQKARFNRCTVPFSYRQMQAALVRSALRAGLQVKLVHPANSSVIGGEKYARMFGISRYAAVADVLGRRGWA